MPSTLKDLNFLSLAVSGIQKSVCLFCFDLDFKISDPVIEYRPDPSCMSYMEACAEMP